MINAERRIFMEMTIMKLLLLLLQLNCKFNGQILRILQYYGLNYAFYSMMHQFGKRDDVTVILVLPSRSKIAF